MASTPPTINDSEFFAEGFRLPVPSKTNFTIVSLDTKIVFDMKTGGANVKKTYQLRKIQSNHEGNDLWFEITGCPDGEFISVGDEINGYRHFVLRDSRHNLLYKIDFGEAYAIGYEFSFILHFTIAGLQKEDKLIEFDSSLFFKSKIFRYEMGYSVPVNTISIDFNVLNGRVIRAWPRSLADLQTKLNRVVFTKQNMKPQEIFAPLVHVESGSKVVSRSIALGLTFVGGLLTTIFSDIIINFFKHIF